MGHKDVTATAAAAAAAAIDNHNDVKSNVHMYEYLYSSVLLN